MVGQVEGEKYDSWSMSDIEQDRSLDELASW